MLTHWLVHFLNMLLLMIHTHALLAAVLLLCGTAVWCVALRQMKQEEHVSGLVCYSRGGSPGA
jgi:hypothetical protein